jgi:pyrroline-5-carboxylate reductase
MRLGVIGTGTIASAVVRAIAGDGHAITVSERSATLSAALAREFANVAVAANQAVLDASDVVFLGLMADAAPEVLGALTFRPDQRVISIIAGVTLDEVAALVAPAKAEAVMIPFPGIAQGGSPVLVRGDAALVTAIFGSANTIFTLDGDADLDAYMCAQAVLSPAVAMVAGAADWLGERVEDARQAEGFLRLLVGSSLTGSQCAPLLAALDTPGGFNQRLRQHMERGGIDDALTDGLNRLEQGQ